MLRPTLAASTMTSPRTQHPAPAPPPLDPKPAPRTSSTTPRTRSSHSRIHVLHLHAVPPARPPRRVRSGTRAPRGRKPRTPHQMRRRNRRARDRFDRSKSHDASRARHRTRGGDGKSNLRLPEPSKSKSERSTSTKLERPRPRPPDAGEGSLRPSRRDHPHSRRRCEHCLCSNEEAMGQMERASVAETARSVLHHPAGQ